MSKYNYTWQIFVQNTAHQKKTCMLAKTLGPQKHFPLPGPSIYFHCLFLLSSGYIAITSSPTKNGSKGGTGPAGWENLPHCRMACSSRQLALTKQLKTSLGKKYSLI